MSDHDEHDEDCEYAIVSAPRMIWRFSTWDVLGIGLTTVGGLFSVVGQGLNLLANEAAAMANWKRQRFDVAEAQKAYEDDQRRAAEELESILGLTEDGGA